MRKAIAIDFDGCLCEDCYPDIGAPHWPVIELAKQRQKDGWALVLWTCRSGEQLEAAIAACAEWGLHFDAVNENLPEWCEAYGNDTRKIGATEYWDDKAVVMPGMDPEDIKEAKALAQIDFGSVAKIVSEAIGLLSDTEIQEEENAPLTLEELREMDGEPVWIKRFDGGKDGWAIYGDMQSIYGVYFQVPVGGMRLPYDGYSTEWLAYRRKPEGGA